MKLKRQFTKLLSIVLIISMLLQLSFPAYAGAASKRNGSFKELQESLKGLDEDESEKIIETYIDEHSLNSAGDWKQAD